MKYIWEPHDIVCGRRIWSHGRPTNGEHLIGYDCGDPHVAKKYVLISLIDGSIIATYLSVEDFAIDLNKYEYRPADINLRAWPDIAPRKD